MRKFALIFLISAAAVMAQSAAKFEFADMHASPKAAPGTPQFMRVTPIRNGKYEIRNGTLVDLIRTAWGFDPDKILDGPSWLEMNRFDIIAKVPNETTPDALKLMLQTLLEERLALKVHPDSKPLPTYVLVAGKKPQMKEADGSGDTGCKPGNVPGQATEGGVRIAMNGVALALGPGNQLQYACRNMTMEAFAAGLRNMLGAQVGTNPVRDETGLKGIWNFDVRWSLGMIGGPADGAERISVFDAVEKQLGLKLEQRPLVTPVLIVDSANETPAANPPGTAEALPPTTVPAAFEVADIKPSDPASNAGRFQMQPGGRLVAQGMTLQFILARAFETISNDQLIGLPKWVEAARFDITAKAPPEAGNLDMFSMAPMLRALLAERFKLKYHTEDRPQNAYTLLAAKPKMKKADPASRTSCKSGNGPSGSPQGTVVMTCQNISMAQFAEQLRGTAQSLTWPVLDSTGLEGGWDLTLTYSRSAGFNFGGPGRGGEGGPVGGDTGVASDPTGGVTIFDAVEKQLGLKLDMQKRPLTVYVIDHMEEKPTEN